MDFEELFNPLSKTEEAELLRQHHEALANAGGVFNGDEWMLVMELLEPIPETVLACAVDPETVRGSADRPTGISTVMTETDYGYVMIIIVTMFDSVENPWHVNVLFNPVPPESRSMLLKLTKQETLAIHCYDRTTGAFITRRMLRLPPEDRAVFAQALKLTRGVHTTPERWERAVAVMRRHGF
jgi:hypothetical protein